MKRTYLLTLLVFTFYISMFSQTTIAGWDLTGNNTANTTIAATVFNSNLTSTSGANNLTRGPSAPASAASNSFRTTGFLNNGIAVTNTDYFQVTLSATAGNKVSLSSIDARFAGTGTYAATPGVSNQFAYSIDGTNFTLIGSAFVNIGSPATLPTINLSTISALQNVNSGTTITLRYYASGQTTTGGWGFNSPSSGTLGLDIKGTVDPTAAPPEITSSLTSSATFNSLYTYTVTASNVPTSFAADGLPAGLSINTNTGEISGTPLTGTASTTAYAVTLSAANANGTGGNATLNLTVNKANQTITFGPLANVLDNAPNFQLTATASSGLPVSYSSSMPAIAAIVPPDFVDPLSPGMTTITASQAGDADYNPATNVDQNLTVVNSAATPQTITFTLSSPATYGDTIKLMGTASSGLQVTYASSNPSIAVISNDTVRLIGVGTVTITASQAGNATFAPALNVDQTLVINPKPLTVINAVAESRMYNTTTNATINGAALSGIIGSDIVTLSAANANFDTPDVGTMKPVTTNYTLTGANASKYTLPSQPSGLNADITKATQTIVFPNIPLQGITNGTYNLNATATSGLPISYSSSNTSVATISGNVATLLSIGSSDITASQAGNSNYLPATDVVKVLTVTVLPVMYSFGTALPGTAAPTSGVPVSNMTFGNVSRVSPVNGTTLALTTTSQSSGYAGASALVNIGNIAKSGPFKVDSSAYFELSITPDAGYRVRLDSISFGSRSTTSGPTSLAIYTNKNNFASSIATVSASNNSVWTLFKPTFDSLSNGNNPLTIRIYGYNGGTSTSVNWRVDDISIKAIALPLACTPPATVTITGTEFLCNGQNSLLTATGGVTYLWEVPTNVTTDTLRVSPTTTKSYVARGYSATGGCYTTDTIKVVVEGLIVTTGANSGPGSLRSVVGCASEGATIGFDPAITTINLTESLLLSKNLILEDNTTATLTGINFDFSTITTHGLEIGTGKTIDLKNLSINAINNSNDLPLIVNDGILNVVNVNTTKL